jgi:hypothetical protein
MNQKKSIYILEFVPILPPDKEESIITEKKIQRFHRRVKPKMPVNLRPSG